MPGPGSRPVDALRRHGIPATEGAGPFFPVLVAAVNLASGILHVRISPRTRCARTAP